MRIISKFSDYYDSGLAYGQDDSLVYVRSTSEVTNEHNSAEFLEAKKLTDIHGRTISVKEEYKPFQREYMPACIYFCGKMYPFYQVEIDVPGKNGFMVRTKVHSFNKEFTKYIKRFSLIFLIFVLLFLGFALFISWFYNLH